MPPLVACGHLVPDSVATSIDRVVGLATLVVCVIGVATVLRCVPIVATGAWYVDVGGTAIARGARLVTVYV